MTHDETVQQDVTESTGFGQRVGAMKAALAQGAKRGMTLVEVLIVLTIMASIAGAVGVFALRALDDANIREAQIEVSNLEAMIQQSMLMTSPRKLPESLNELTQGNPPITRRVPLDPWGQEYVYRKTNNREFELFSAGPDGQEGTEDDISKE